MKSTYLLLLIIILPLQSLFVTNAFAQQADPSRIQEKTYKLIIYNQTEDRVENIRILDRSVEFTTFDSQKAIEITETINDHARFNTTKTIINRETLLPLYQEKYENDSLKVTSHFRDTKIEQNTYQEDGSKVTELIDKPTDAYSSNSFSELVQSNDFTRNPTFTFKTYAPGTSPSTFKVERLKDEKIQLPGGKTIDTWILKFTRTSESGEVSDGGHRYIDKKDGKVIAFKLSLTQPYGFSYQMLFIK